MQRLLPGHVTSRVLTANCFEQRACIIHTLPDCTVKGPLDVGLV